MGAITNYEAYLKTEPNNAGVRSNLGAAYVRLGRLADGVTEYRKALAIDPGNPMFRFNLALALYKGGKFAEAVTELQGVLAKQADHLQARLLLGDCYLKQGRHQDVVDLLAPWEASYAGDRGFAYILGTAFIQTDRMDQGQRVIDTIFKDGESAEGHLLMGTVHMNAGDSPAALAELRKAVELNPQLPVANGMLGRALLRNGEHEAALRAFLRELEINPDDFDTNLQVGELKKRDQQFDDAQDLHRARAADAPRRRRRPLRPVGRVRVPGQERGGAAAARGRGRGRAEVLGGLRACSRPSTTACSARPTAIACARASSS